MRYNKNANIALIWFNPLPQRKLLSELRESSRQARSQDLKKGGGGFFERVRKLQTTLTRIFIVLESESHGLSDFGRFILKIETEISAKIGNSNAFSAKKKKRSSPKLKRKKNRPKLEIQTLFQPKYR